MTQILGKKGRRKWKHSLPQQHITRKEAEDVHYAMHHIETHVCPGGDAFWEHVNECKHCGLIWEDVDRKAMVKTIARMRELDKERALRIHPFFTGCRE